MDGYITEIQRFSLNDGPGIRTTVFLKGCDLRCKWCHNPETYTNTPDLFFYENKCAGCGKCFELCPAGAHQITGGKHVIDRALCKKCGACASGCFTGALKLSGALMSVEAVMKEILQDKLYYSESGGGVTLSGGEALMQPEFAESLMDACHAADIKVGIETNLCHPWERMLPILKKADLVMSDLKLFDDKAHMKWTGAGSSLIIENIRKLSGLGRPFIIRTPLIPGATATEENLRQICAFLSTLPALMRYELLNFNPLGGSKFGSLGLPYGFKDCKPYSPAELRLFESIVDQYHIPYKLI